MVAGGMLPGFEDDEEFDNQHQGKGATGNGKHRAEKDTPGIVYLMSVLSAMGGFLFGYDTGIVSGAMIFVKTVFDLSSLWQEFVVSITILGAWVLSLFAGGLSEHYGRKTIILWASVVFTVGSIMMGVAWSKYILLFGRLIVGVAIGLASTVVPMYIAEVAPQNLRGSLVTLNNCFITFGQLSAAITAGAFSYDKVNGWRWMLALAAIPAVVQFGGFMFMPESPRWLIRRNRDEEALVALKRIRGHKNPNVLREFEKIRQNQLELVIQDERRKEQKRNIIVAIFRKTATRRALIVGCLLQAIQQLAGINTVMYYTATIITMSGVQSESIAVWLSVPTAMVYVLFSFCGYLIADRVGRRVLTLGSLFGVIISLLILGTGFHLNSMDEVEVTTHNMSTLEVCFSKRDCASCIAEPRCGLCYDAQNLATATCLERDPDDDKRSIGGECSLLGNHGSNFVFTVHMCPSMTKGIGLNTWLVLTGLVLYLAAFAPGMAPMPWTINSEIYPMWARSFCYSISTSINWMFNLLISLTFISLTEILTRHGTFYMYSIIASIGWLLLFWKLPETRGRSLEDISQLFAKERPDDQEIIDDDTSGSNQSPVVPSSNQTSQFQLKQHIGLTKKHSAGLCHDNLAFACDAVTHPNYNQMIASTEMQVVPQSDSEISERNRSFKLANPLARAADIAISQPDLQSQSKQHHLHHHQNPHQQAQSQPRSQTQLVSSNQTQVPPPSTIVSNPKQQHQQPKRKYSNDDGDHH